MLTVFNVKPAVIMLGIVSAVFSGSAVMPCQFHSIVVFLPSFDFLSNGKCQSSCTQGTRHFLSFGSFAASPADFSVRQYPVRSDAEHHFSGQWLPPLTCTGKLHSLYPCWEGLRPLYSPLHQLSLMRFLPNSLTEIWAKNKPAPDTTFL